MKFNDFGKKAKQNIAEKHNVSVQQLDEIIPALAAGARVAGGVAAKGLGAAGRAGATGVKKAGQAAGRVGQQMGQKAKSAVKTVAQDAATKAMDKASDIAADKLLKIGTQVPIAGKILKIDDVKGDEITIADPKNPKGPKTVLPKNSQEIKDLIQGMMGQQR